MDDASAKLDDLELEFDIKDSASEMGCCASCKKTNKDDVEDQYEAKDKAPKKKKDNAFQWEVDFLENTVMASGSLTKACIVGFPDGKVRATSDGFQPDKNGIKDIIAAFEGKVDGLTERNLQLGGGMKTSQPGKMGDTYMYGNDGEGGGCYIFKSKESLLIIIFEPPTTPEMADRLGEQSAKHMTDNNH